ncbi:M20/M25/M40 family metallo-hydrolase [Phenylobacterium sp. J367]|uniref:M20/M25/M40 family metallo-hydrolase n=1 Tax=Phenylobacterium sp. J367 TaxID=2898435 RepID=UPI0027E36A32|nr:M20/M25/M40 family metallo-hydrolase [Phenylobacterium sp. J367]
MTNNHRELTARMKPTLARAAGGKIQDDIDYITGAEDFSYYQLKVPGLFYDLGIGNPPGVNHSPFFTIDESAMEVGVRAQALTALDFLSAAAP